MRKEKSLNGSSKAAKRIEEILIQVGIKLMGYIEPFNLSFKIGTCGLSKGVRLVVTKPGILHLGAVRKKGLNIKQGLEFKFQLCCFLGVTCKQVV